MANEPDNNTLNIQPRSYTNGVGKKVLEYITADTIVRDLPFIMTSSTDFGSIYKKMASNGKNNI